MHIAGSATASASVAWCVFDPPTQRVTPGGHNIAVTNLVYLRPVDRHVMGEVSDGTSASLTGMAARW